MNINLSHTEQNILSVWLQECTAQQFTAPSQILLRMFHIFLTGELPPTLPEVTQITNKGVDLYLLTSFKYLSFHAPPRFPLFKLISKPTQFPLFPRSPFPSAVLCRSTTSKDGDCECNNFRLRIPK